MQEVLKAIPHRPPFLFVDNVNELDQSRIRASREISPSEPFFQGHYPGNPIMPGVLICESIFQAGAILLSSLIEDPAEGVPVLTRISNAKFKNMVKPGSLLELEAELVEKLGSAYFLKGKASVAGKTVVTVEFAVSLAKASL
ncbi:MAG: 3-hydroxyacyl-ACP dehydratase FabZ [Dehalococcoidia bacterium]|nr:3-hydroxyacyl-ACP dehydratase FabZ [Dehalococcoidia bacterium]